MMAKTHYRVSQAVEAALGKIAVNEYGSHPEPVTKLDRAEVKARFGKELHPRIVKLIEADICRVTKTPEQIEALWRICEGHESRKRFEARRKEENRRDIYNIQLVRDAAIRADDDDFFKQQEDIRKALVENHNHRSIVEQLAISAWRCLQGRPSGPFRQGERYVLDYLARREEKPLATGASDFGMGLSWFVEEGNREPIFLFKCNHPRIPTYFNVEGFEKPIATRIVAEIPPLPYLREIIASIENEPTIAEIVEHAKKLKKTATKEESSEHWENFKPERVFPGKDPHGSLRKFLTETVGLELGDERKRSKKKKSKPISS